jgi:hypothetical protein
MMEAGFDGELLPNTGKFAGIRFSSHMTFRPLSVLIFNVKGNLNAR